jgi:hypothetical protein
VKTRFAGQPKTKLSCVDPQTYKVRFQQFMFRYVVKKARYAINSDFESTLWAPVALKKWTIDDKFSAIDGRLDSCITPVYDMLELNQDSANQSQFNQKTEEQYAEEEFDRLMSKYGEGRRFFVKRNR